MKNEDFYAPPQPYSQSLRTIAILLETRESDEDCVAQIKRFLERSGIPVRDRPA